MPDFAYIARNQTGEKVNGTLTAASERDALSQLAGLSLFPIDVSQQEERRKLGFSRSVSGQLMAMTYAQMAALLRAGVPLLRAVAVVREQTSNKTLKNVLNDVYSRVEDGTTLEFKFTLGSWDTEALDADGGLPANHTIDVTSDQRVAFTIDQFREPQAPTLPSAEVPGLHGSLVYRYDWPSGPSIVLLGAAVLCVSRFLPGRASARG